jgi:glycosyltransferase involved in cell wall biosynthesis
MSTGGASAADRPTVSVIMGVFDGEAYLADALESVFAQTHPAVELVVVDDGSQDRTPEILAGYRDRLVVLRQERGGIAASRNAALEVTGGELLTFLDADDLLAPEALERELAVLAADPELDMVCSFVQEFLSPELDDEIRAQLRAPGPPVFSRQPNGVLAWRSSFDRVGPFSTTFRRGVGIDWVARASELGLVWGELPEVLRLRRLHGENHGMREKADVLQYVQVMKAHLDRRRAGS